MMIHPDDVLRALKARHKGRLAGVTANALTVEITGRANPAAVRALRSAIEDLRRAGEPVCGKPQTGYYYSDQPQDIEETINFLRQRAMTTLVQIKPLERRLASARRGQMALFT
ncbi:MAG: hypothetical protein OEY50_12410 [Nitrospinota bacterium]|nr:hypothetical protein [Nitrospinota bacterium]